ncbi:MAG: SRPBCC family protein [Candidatus Melainabacteria bacterium]|nr:SRPBCC family protein [Candidatus Melainabacteria bacterium]
MRMNLKAATVHSLSALMVLVVSFAPGTVSQEVVAKGRAQNAATTFEIVEQAIGGKIFSVSRMVVRARPEQVWQVLTDYDNASLVFPNLRKCQVVQDKGATKIVCHEVQPSGVPGTFKYVLEIKEIAPRMLEWHRVKGDFRDVDGLWKLEPSDGGRCTLVTYAAYVNGGLFMPQPLIRRQFRIDIPGVMAALKLKTETSVAQIARRVDATKSN